ncbi:MAG TPA: sigma-70 family RNA polymerase sigma factor [Polyangia bacterium]|jgi:RNA polymerase sigma-70 factor (ECF subfamily)|nr:sigma-70 family RNA polymerase sigma factor [Polyangia bacterium]
MSMAATRFEQPAIDDAALANALKRREPRATVEVWTAYSPMVLSYLRRYFGPGRDSDAQDLCQEVFLRLFKRIDELRDPAALRGFLMSIALGVARNGRRRAWVRRWIGLTPSGELPDVPAVASWDPDAREALARLYGLLDRLSAEDRSLFITRYVEKMEIVAIAGVHGLTLATAKRRLARVTRRLGARIDRDPALAGYLEGPWKGASSG